MTDPLREALERIRGHVFVNCLGYTGKRVLGKKQVGEKHLTAGDFYIYVDDIGDLGPPMTLDRFINAALSAPPVQEPLFLARQAARHALQFLRDPTHQGDGHLDQCIASLEAVLDTEPKAVTPPGVEPGSGPTIAEMSGRFASNADIFEDRRAGSGHECAARKAHDWAERALTAYRVSHNRTANDESAREVETCVCSLCTMAEHALVELRRAHPCPSPMTREKAERMAREVVHTVYPNLNDPSARIVKAIADALQSVAGSEDTRLLDWLGSRATSIHAQYPNICFVYADGYSHVEKTLRDAIRAAIAAEKTK